MRRPRATYAVRLWGLGQIAASVIARRVPRWSTTSARRTLALFGSQPFAARQSRFREQVGMDRTRLNRFINQTLLELPLEEVTAVEPSQSVRSALALMREGSRSCVLAISGDRLAGIFTERDVLTKCMGEGFDWDQPLEASVLTRSPSTIAANATVADAIAAMQQHHYRTLPVMDGDKVVGLIRMGDLLTHLAEAYPEDILNLPPRPHQVMERPEGG